LIPAQGRGLAIEVIGRHTTPELVHAPHFKSSRYEVITGIRIVADNTK
jgi:hypothetical protein